MPLKEALPDRGSNLAAHKCLRKDERTTARVWLELGNEESGRS